MIQHEQAIAVNTSSVATGTRCFVTGADLARAISASRLCSGSSLLLYRFRLLSMISPLLVQKALHPEGGLVFLFPPEYKMEVPYGAPESGPVTKSPQPGRSAGILPAHTVRMA